MFGALSIGCSANLAASSEATDAEAGAVTGIVTVERTTGTAGAAAGTGGEIGAKSDVIARFVRSKAGTVDEDALRILGATLDLPAPGAACIRLPAASLARTGGPSKMARNLELLNVGSLSFELPETPATPARPEGKLVARRLPDVVDLVSGVVYTARGEGEAFPAKGRYVFRAAGAPEQDIAPFVIEATAKGEPGDLRIADQAISPLTPPAHRADSIVLSTTDPVDVTWTSLADGDGDDDLIYIDVSGASVGSGVRCSFADTGRATLAPTAFVSDEGTIAVHRVHRESFRARGIDSGVLRFDFARVSTFRRLPSEAAAAAVSGRR